MASAPYASMTASGFMPVPRLFDIRPPAGACTVEWMTTSVNGTSPIISSPAKIIRFSQRRLPQFRHGAPPLERDTRLDPGLAAVTQRDGMSIRLALLELIVFLEPHEHALIRLLLREPRQLAGLLVHAAVGTNHGDLRQTVVDADLVVRRIVTGRDLERARSELTLHALVGDHGHSSLDHGHDHLTADELAVAIVVRMHRDRDVREDRRGANRRDRHVAVALRERIADVRERVVDVNVGELEGGQRRQVERT